MLYTHLSTSTQLVMSKKNIHVVPNGSTWAVRTEGNQRATTLASTQTAAIAAARDIAIQRLGEVFIHRPDGRIRDRNSYGGDPKSSKG